MDSHDWLDSYRVHEQEWDGYDDLYESFEWKVPDHFNIATYACDRWAADESGVALYYESEEGDEAVYTFSELQESANRLANYFADDGIRKGDRIGISAPSTPMTAITYLAAWKLGAIPIPLSTHFAPDALGYRLRDSGADGFIVDEMNLDAFRAVKDEIPALSSVITVGAAESEDDEVRFWDALEDGSPEFETVTTRADDGALLIYTSGTTGDPKGVLHGHRWLLGNLPSDVGRFSNMEIRESDVYWGVSSWAWLAGVEMLLNAWFWGQPWLANKGQFDVNDSFRLIEEYGVSNVFIPPTALRMMMQVDAPEDEYDLESVRVLLSGGESLGQTVADWADRVFDGAVVHEGYGQTEMNPVIGECTALMEGRDGSMGRAAIGRKVRIVDPETEAPVESGTVGEISVYAEGDPGRMKEYWNKPQQTEAKFRDGWLLTGDLAKRDEDGYYYFVGRKDDVIVSSGYRIGPGEIEDSVVDHEAVANAGVIGIPDDLRGEIAKAFITLADEREPSDELGEDIKSYVKGTLATHEYPREIEFVDELPTTTTGKIRRRDLRIREGLLDQ